MTRCLRQSGQIYHLDTPNQFLRMTGYTLGDRRRSSTADIARANSLDQYDHRYPTRFDAGF